MSLAWIAVPALFLVAAGDEWSQWRGPQRDAVSPAAIANWPAKLNAKWKIEVGEGHSSPIYGAGRIYVFARHQDQETIRAIEPATGKVLWQQAYGAPYEMSPPAVPHGKGPKSTPIFWNGKLYTFGINGMLACWDAATGKPIWKHDFKTTPAFGGAMSPMVYSGSLIVHGGTDNNGALTAFEANTGKIQWTWKDDGPAYSSPVIADVEGTPQLITQSQKNLIAVNARTGQLIWKVPFTTAYEQNSVTPVVRNGILVYSGLDNGVTAARLTAKGPQTLWQSKTVAMYMNSPVWKGDLLCGFSHRNKGQYFCLNATNGNVLWTSPGRQGENSAMVLAGDRILALNNEAQLQILALQEKAYQVLHEYKAADSATWAHPGIVPGGILIKDFRSLSFFPL
jgi:outer membrane protein assembly factor BamB